MPRFHADTDSVAGPPPEVLAEIDAAWERAQEPQVAVGSHGNATAVWERYTPRGTRIQSATRPAGGSWSAPVNLSPVKQATRSPKLALDPQGGRVTLGRSGDGAEPVAR